MSDKKNLKLSNHLLAFRKHMDRLVVFNNEEWAVLCSHLYLKKLNKKQHFAIDGEICDDLGFVISGSLRFYYVKDGEEITGYYSPNNRFISSYKSFIRRKASTLAIQAVHNLLQKRVTVVFATNTFPHCSQSLLKVKFELITFNF
ncbi:hypothetical protein AAFN85_22555 [Mucilaginibacter sp. CAU 1740]|uniref:hypothetical protein n=1 Tax=Mucilaginibacter sp. CAU 1740 TaxID=3140365 RepID=UPI00325A51D2